ncbi:MAG: HAD-IA family hydrolase [Cyanobacteriota bacterium]|nr:HAD-IA family hydrolase [Cyanobacteriota bacterium]
MVSLPTCSLRALLWDVDGTLAETERDGHRLAFNRAFAEAGVPLHWDPEQYGELLRVSGGRERIGAALLALRGKPAAAAELEALQAAKQRHYRDLIEAGAINLRPGVIELIHRAATAGVRQAIVTTSGRSAVRSLLRHALGSLAKAFELWVCGDDVISKKPHPEAYQLALNRLNLQPQEVMAIEDSGNGLQAARGAGLPCLITLSVYGAGEPAHSFAAARAVVDRLGPGGKVVQGPACGAEGVTLDYLERLLVEAC